MRILTDIELDYIKLALRKARLGKGEGINRTFVLIEQTNHVGGDTDRECEEKLVVGEERTITRNRNGIYVLKWAPIVYQGPHNINFFFFFSLIQALYMVLINKF